MKGILLLCVANSARSQMAEAGRQAAFRQVRDELRPRIATDLLHPESTGGTRS